MVPPEFSNGELHLPEVVKAMGHRPVELDKKKRIADKEFLLSVQLAEGHRGVLPSEPRPPEDKHPVEHFVPKDEKELGLACLRPSPGSEELAEITILPSLLKILLFSSEKRIKESAGGRSRLSRGHFSPPSCFC
jgi:hypothetical protein